MRDWCPPGNKVAHFAARCPPAAVRMRTEGQLPGMGPPRALDLKTRRLKPLVSSPAVGHPADAGPCPAQGSRTPTHKANSIPVNVLPSSSSPPHRGPRSKRGQIVQGPHIELGTSSKNRPKSARSPLPHRHLPENPSQTGKSPLISTDTCQKTPPKLASPPGQSVVMAADCGHSDLDCAKIADSGQAGCF